MKVLILCTGNSCRSQMAHGFLQALDSNLVVRSAGTEASGKLNEKAVAVMKEVGITAFVELLIVFFMLGLGLMYAWKKGALKWV